LEVVFERILSVGVAVSLTYGNNGEDKLAKSLHVPFGQERLNTTYAGLLWKVQGEGQPRSHDLSLANKIWLTDRPDCKVFPEFIQKARDNYVAPPERVNFKEKVKAAGTINDWCAEKTRGKIKQILIPADVGDSTFSVLTNAIYFKGDWKYQFKKDQTKDGPFTTAAGKTVRAPMRNQLLQTGYRETPEAQILELPYRGEDLSMVVILPRHGRTLAEVEKNLTIDQYERWTRGLARRKVQVTLPRFKLEPDRVELKEKLIGLGLPLDAVPNIGTPPPGMVLYVDKVLHRGFVEVNEQGAEAAAVTAVIVNFKDKGGAEDLTPVFRADHPFLFVIRDNRSGCILFVGRLVEPKG
jgi:serpin B